MDWLDYYTKKKDLNSLDQIFGLIEEVLEIDRITKPARRGKLDILKEEFERGKEVTLTLQAIPEIAVSELGWTDVSGKGESVIEGPERKRLSQFLENVQGSDFVEKVQSLAKFYEDPDAAMQMMFPEGEAGSTAERIKVALSYMVFYKTLTKVISNFNAASAGFNFEAFLAVLAGGFQVPANKGTIADFVSRSEGMDVPISLKLYGEGHLHVGGSFQALVEDLVSPQYEVPQMRYIACTKQFEDDKKAGLDINGTIKFMRFDFTLQNVMNILAISSKKSKENVLLAREFIRRFESGEEDLDYRSTLPGISLPSVQELENEYIGFLRPRLRALGLKQGEIDEMVNVVQWAHNDNIFLPVQSVEYDEQGEKSVVTQVIRAVSPIPSSMSSKGDSRAIFSQVLNMVMGHMPQRLVPQEGASNRDLADYQKNVKKIANEIAKANNTDLLSKYNVADLNKQRAEMLEGAFDGVTIEKSLQVYNSLANDPEKQKIALQNSFGYLNRKQFNLVQNAVENLDSLVPSETPVMPKGQDSVVFGQIQVGARNTQNMLNRMTSVLNEAIFDIFLSVKSIQDNAYSYVAGGMQEDQKADAAITASSQVISKTMELKSKK
tara:strand:- start:98 stop:1918 length:1821 start_codon:yes stop_codon:yes gene_type:complete